MINRMLAVLVLTSGVVLSWTASAHANVVEDWNRIAGDAAIAACIAPLDDPLHESRAYAMAHLAIHDALNAIDRRSQPYVFAGQAPAGTSIEATVASAARHVLVPLFSALPFPFPPACGAAGAAVIEAAYVHALSLIEDSPEKTAGIELGQAAASAILALREGDGSDTPLLDFDYPQGTQPGEYRFTPGFTFVFAPGWSNVTPFVLHHASQFRPGTSPYPVTGKKFAADFNEVKTLGGDGITSPTTRSAEQTEMALFWVESSPLQWNRIARSAAQSRALDVWESARLFALLNMALADGYISAFEAKNHYNFWRPVTAIHEGAADGNPNTQGDPTWAPLVPTPPIPDYDSAHSVEGAAAAEVLARFFGTDDVSFSTCSLTLPVGSRCSDETPVFRFFSSFSAAADENGLSRILVGFHFRQAVEAGLKHGRHIGKRAVNLFLKPAQ